MKIFVSGIAGFIGSNFANQMHKLGHEVSGCDNLTFGYEENVNKEIPWERIGFQHVDYNHLNEFDVVVHIACVNIIYAMKYSQMAFKTNGFDSIKFIDKFKGKIVYTSTSSVYGQAESFPTKEDSGVKLSNAYDQSKSILENYLILRGNYTTLRLSNVYGTNQRPKNPYCGVVGRFLGNMIEDKPININGDGSDTRDYTYIDDVVRAIRIACTNKSYDTEINIGTGIETSSFKLASLIRDIISSKSEINFTDKRLIDKINRRCLDIKKAEELLSWKPIYDLQTGIEETIKWMMNEKK
jgi:UDP-glucose 4-epimerase